MPYTNRLSGLTTTPQACRVPPRPPHRRNSLKTLEMSAEIDRWEVGFHRFRLAPAIAAGPSAKATIIGTARNTQRVFVAILLLVFQISARPGGGGAAQTVVDRMAEAVVGDRGDRDPGEGGAVELAQHREQIGGGFGEVGGAAEPCHFGEAGRGGGAKGEERFAGTGAESVEAQRQ
jgi:hypothetical protein